jgi:hypothetical protein
MTDLRHSRAIRLGASASGRAESQTAARLATSHVALSFDVDALGAAATAEVLVETLARRPGRVTFVGMPDTIAQELAERARSIDPAAAISTADEAPHDTTIGLHVGRRSERSLPPDAARLLALPDAHGAHLAMGNRTLLQSSEPSSLGVMTTAALAAAEVFKHAAGVRPNRMVLQERLSFCPVTLTDDPSRAPSLRRPTTTTLALIGVGAIGTATIRIISGLPLTGSATVVDRESFAVENIGTYSLGSGGDVGRKKVDVVAAALPRFGVTKMHGDVNDLSSRIDSGEIAWPNFVLNGLDSADARRAAQRVWPDFVIDGATGDTAAGLHEVIGTSAPCLRCFFPEPEPQQSALVALSDYYGLTVEQLSDGDRLLQPADLNNVTPKQRMRLEAHLGRPICGLARATGLTTEDSSDNYRPSVPFVSQLAACLVVGRLIARLSNPGSELPNFVQFDTLVGPQTLHAETRKARTSCYCRENRSVIETVRANRQGT